MATAQREIIYVFVKVDVRYTYLLFCEGLSPRRFRPLVDAFFSSVRQKWRNTTSPLSHRQRRQRRGQHTDTGREEPSSSRVLTRTRIIAKERPQLYGVSFLQIQTLFRWGYPLFSMTYRSLQGWHDKGGSHRRQQRSDLVQRRKRTRTQKGHTVLVMA